MTDPMTDHKAEFAGYLTDTKNASANTQESYLRDLSLYTHFLEGAGVDDTVNGTPELVNRYLKNLENEGKSQSTITRTISSIRNYYKFLQVEGLVQQNPCGAIKVHKPKRVLPSTLTSAEIDLLLSQPDVSNTKGCRDKAMLEILYATGIRVSELVDLQIDDINLQLEIIHCRSTKTERVVPLYSSAVKAVTDYIERVRPMLMVDAGENALFLNMSGQRLTRQGFWKIIKSYAKSAGITKEITPHTVRHSFATLLLENGASLKDIQEMMGYADISSTQVYANALQEKYTSAYKKFHPKLMKTR